MKKALSFFCFIFASVLLAAPNENKIPPEIDMNFARDYWGKGDYTKLTSQIIEADEFFKKANEYLNNPELAVYKQPDASIEGKGKTIFLPNYEKAMELLLRSIYTFNNPVSAYEFRYIAKTIYGGEGLLKKEYKNALPRVTKILVDNRVCEAYIDYGRELEDANKTNEAIEFYKEGMKECSKIPWITNIMAGRLAHLRKK